MAKRSKFFCIAVEGATCDGRTLDRAALQEMADTYNPQTYQARINMEHIRGFSAEPPFNAYGDVVALETREVELQLGGKAEKKLGLFAQVDALDPLVQLQGKGQKLFSSIELNPNFAATGKAYLQGLAVTDSPASLGTQVMEFAAKAGDANPFAQRKIDKGNFFSAGHEIAGFDFADPAPEQETESKKLFAAATEFFKNFGKAPEPPKVEEKPAEPKAAANDNELAAQIGEGFSRISAVIAQQGQEFTAALNQLRSDHNALKASIEGTEKSAPQRQLATGQSANFARTDC